ncbi:DUF6884 domain-containing protein [Neobacillus ginsengisoli]|uniref:RNA-binding protein n=1 Tax=Neobacillus ginsengisoli TaxID=904295 RepID=A0ABT9Y0B3_9BACI|nr:DUF6884 domain-containing protein [Neobacillus ginsengisoli]MDQ0201073.1 putative RNA-binding protein [Neobacillus ginsengisoli]
MKIALVSCTKLKEEYPCEAKKLYSKSTLFKKAVNYIEAKDYDDWYVLSAKYGLLSKDKVIEPYDVTLNKMNIRERKFWAESVLRDIVKIKPNEIDFYAGNKYREHLIKPLRDIGILVNVPLEGKAIGEQLRFYTERHEEVK